MRVIISRYKQGIYGEHFGPNMGKIPAVKGKKQAKTGKRWDRGDKFGEGKGRKKE